MRRLLSKVTNNRGRATHSPWHKYITRNISGDICAKESASHALCCLPPLAPDVAVENSPCFETA